MRPPDASEPPRTVITDDSATAIRSRWQRWVQEQCPEFPDPGSGGPSRDEVLAVLRFDQCQRWREGDRVPAESYLQKHSFLRDDPDQALLLIYGELLLREELGEAPTLDEYLARFPDHADRLREQDEFHRLVEGVSWLGAGGPPPARAGACRVVGEVGRGGMGVVLKGHDERLDRDLAIKVLRDEYAGRPDVVRRFLEEARVSGQLQHPGVAPVHEVGALDDGRPYFTMKLVQGRTLAELLAGRASPSDDLPRFLKVFEQACQAVAYAHSKGVVHRDLKPANVMVGAFGEVQVMDWGLAKRLREQEAPEEKKDGADVIFPSSTDPLSTVRGSPSEEGRTRVGEVIGTPAYMAPEQARGEAGRVDERADVFGLGALLCEVLTGGPPFAARLAHEALRHAAQGDLAEALGRLDGCGADPELVALAKECLAAEASDRPRDAGVVAGRVTAYLAGVQERLRRAERDRAAAQARAEAAAAKAAVERRARRLTAGLATAGLALVVVAGAGGLWLVQQRAQTAAGAQAALDKAWQLQVEGKRPEAEAAVEQAEALLAGSWGHADLRRRVREVRADVEMADALEEIWFRQVDLIERNVVPDARRTDQAYAEAFQNYGLPVEELTAEEAGERIRPRAIALPLALALDAWAGQRQRRPRGESEGWRHLVEVARRADPDPWRDRFRAALLADDPKALRALAAEARQRELPAPSWRLLALAVRRVGGGQLSLDLLQRAEHQHPGDFWIHFDQGDLALTAVKPPQHDEAIRHYAVARALRPNNPVVLNNLGYALMEKGLPDAAIPILREAIRLRPDFAEAHLNLGACLGRKKAWDEELAAYDEALRHKPGLPQAHYNRGLALKKKKRYADALAAFDRDVELRPKSAAAHAERGAVFLLLGEPAKALAALDRAIERNPKDLKTLVNRSDAFLRLRKYPDALAAADRALEHYIRSLEAHINRGVALAHLGRLPDALAAIDRAVALDPKPDQAAKVHLRRGQILKRLGRPKDALDAFTLATELDPGMAEAHSDRSDMLLGLNQPAGALAAADRALKLKPDLPQAHGNRGLTLARLGRPADALAAFDRAAKLGLASAPLHHARGRALVNLSRLPEAADAFREAVSLNKDFAEAYYGLGLALQETGQLTEALKALKRCDELGSKRPRWPHPTKQLVRDCERLIALDKKLPDLLRGDAKPADADEAARCARLCHIRKRYGDEVRFYEAAFAADPKLAEDLNAGHRYHAACAAVLVSGGRDKGELLDDEARARRRKQALDWLRAELTVRAQLVAATPKARPGVQQFLSHWQHDRDLAGVRDEAELAKLPEEERQAWRRFWGEVDALRKRAGAKD